MRFLLAEGWLRHYLNFAVQRLLPAMSKLLEAPFWLESRRGRILYDFLTVSGNWRYSTGCAGARLGKAVHRVVTEGHQPRAGVDKEIARMKRMLSE